jgi:hypothetical protein
VTAVAPVAAHPGQAVVCVSLVSFAFTAKAPDTAAATVAAVTAVAAFSSFSLFRKATYNIAVNYRCVAIGIKIYRAAVSFGARFAVTGIAAATAITSGTAVTADTRQIICIIRVSGCSVAADAAIAPATAIAPVAAVTAVATQSPAVVNPAIHNQRLTSLAEIQSSAVRAGACRSIFTG